MNRLPKLLDGMVACGKQIAFIIAGKLFRRNVHGQFVPIKPTWRGRQSEMLSCTATAFFCAWSRAGAFIGLCPPQGNAFSSLPT